MRGFIFIALLLAAGRAAATEVAYSCKMMDSDLSSAAEPVRGSLGVSIDSQDKSVRFPYGTESGIYVFTAQEIGGYVKDPGLLFGGFVYDLDPATGDFERLFQAPGGYYIEHGVCMPTGSAQPSPSSKPVTSGAHHRPPRAARSLGIGRRRGQFGAAVAVLEAEPGAAIAGLVAGQALE
jgi:hypothetical protein